MIYVKGYYMGEPTLESIEDYDTLKGEKKRVIWVVVIASLIMGIVYTIASNVYGKEEPTSVDKIYKTVPMR